MSEGPREGWKGSGSKKAGMRSQQDTCTRPGIDPVACSPRSLGPPPFPSSLRALYQRSHDPSRYVPKYVSRPTNPELGTKERKRERARRPRRGFLDRHKRLRRKESSVLPRVSARYSPLNRFKNSLNHKQREVSKPLMDIYLKVDDINFVNDF